MNKKKSFITIILLFLLFGINIDKVEAYVTFDSAGDTGDYKISDSCTKLYCAALYSDYGIRVTIIDKDGNIKKTHDFWQNDGRDVSIGNFEDKYKINLYSEYVNNITADEVIKILKVMYNTNYEGESTNAILNSMRDYFLMIEPLYSIEMRGAIEGTAIGTSKEIIASSGTELENCNSGTLPYTFEGRLACFYFGGNNSAVGGNWNVVRNMIFALYYPSDGKLTGLNATAFDGANASKYLAACEGEEFHGYTNGCNTIPLLIDTVQRYSPFETGLGVGYVKISDLITGVTLKIHKTNDAGSNVSNAEFHIMRHEDSTLVATCKTDASGNCTATALLNNGENYDVYEVSFNNSYLKASCYENSAHTISCGQISNKNSPFEIGISATDTEKTLYVVNERSCVGKFNDLKSRGIVSMIQRLNLFNTYSSNTNLLNMSMTDGGDACSSATCLPPTPIKGCLRFSLIPTFSATNMSCYTDTITAYIGTASDHNDLIGYCGLKYNISNDSGKLSYFGEVLPGRIVYSFENENTPISTANVNRTCYIYNTTDKTSGTLTIADSTANESVDRTAYSSYISEFKFNNTALTPFTITANNSVDNTLFSAGYATYIKTYTAQYQFKPIYLDFGSGQYTQTSTATNYLVGYGIVSSFKNKVDSTYEDYGPAGMTIKLPFFIKYKFRNQVLEALNETCAYKIVSDPFLPDFEFRSIDPSFPFPGKNGVGRKVGSNWKIILPPSGVSVNDWITSLNNTITTKKDTRVTSATLDYDLNGDNRITQIDLDILKYIKDNQTSIDLVDANKNNNYLVSYVMEVRPNSYSMGTPKYQIILTSADIKAIREYNATTKYDNVSTLAFNTVTGVYTNKFLDNLKLRKVGSSTIKNALVIN